MPSTPKYETQRMNFVISASRVSLLKAEAHRKEIKISELLRLIIDKYFDQQMASALTIQGQLGQFGPAIGQLRPK